MKIQELYGEITSHYFLKLCRIMKLSLFLILVAIFQLSAESAYSQITSLSLSLKNKTIEEVLDKIEQDTEFSFLVLDKQLDMHKQVSIQTTENSIEQILDDLFKNTNISYQTMHPKSKNG